MEQRKSCWAVKNIANDYPKGCYQPSCCRRARAFICVHACMLKGLHTNRARGGVYLSVSIAPDNLSFRWGVRLAVWVTADNKVT